MVVSNSLFPPQLRQRQASCLIIGAAFFVAVAGFAQAAEPIQGPIVADVVSVYDGDTFTVSAHPWPGISIRTAVRVRGVDTPELRGKCLSEKRLARMARDFVVEAVENRVTLYDVRLGKYAGRVIADVEVAGGVLSDMLIEAGLGRPYDGGRRRSWCDG